MSKTILVTGATSGFGRAIAKRFAKNGYTVCITGRREDRLEALKTELEQAYGAKIIALNFDIRDKQQVITAIDALKTQIDRLDVLVNNAGLASGLSTIDEGDTDDWDAMIDTNIKGLLYTTRIISNLMIKNGKGHIINIGSVAGKEVYANGNVYCATKHAVDALNKGMRIDLLAHNIKVTAINPGMVETEFSIVRFDGDEERAKKVYMGLQALKPEDIAETIFWVANRPAHVNINDIIIMPTAQASATNVNRK